VRTRDLLWDNAHGTIQPEIQQTYTGLQSDLQALASKIGELESEADEHECV
jgi:prefoldin subunit 2